MSELFQWSEAVLLLVFLVIAVLIPTIVMYADDDTVHHQH